MLNFITKTELCERLYTRFSDNPIGLHDFSKTKKEHWYAIGPIVEFAGEQLGISWFDIRLPTKEGKDYVKTILAEACRELNISYIDLPNV